MVNFIWMFLLGAGALYAGVNGNIDVVTQAAFSAAAGAVTIVIELCGLLCLWLGVMRIAEASGLVRLLSRIVSPVAAKIFPDVPREHPAFSAMVMNISANILGLGNAATPFGLKAMEHLQELNPDKEIASAPMITFLVLNTSCITLIPTLVISLRSAAGSVDPAIIIGPTIIATATGTIMGLLLDRALRRHYQKR